MLIDFHTHCFPDFLAPRAIENISKGTILKPYTDATLSSTLDMMEKCGVDKSVMLSIATNDKQQENVNNFALEVNSDKVIAFGSVFPGSERVYNLLQNLKDNNIKGIKLHPEFQETDIEDKKYYEICEICEDMGLIVVFHCGHDATYPNSLRCTPNGIAKLKKRFKKLDIVAAHLGGIGLWDNVVSTLADTGAYIDTAFLTKTIKPEKAREVILNFDHDKILFGSDLPWDSPKETLDFLLSLNVDDKILEKIKYKNAKNLLNL